MRPLACLENRTNFRLAEDDWVCNEHHRSYVFIDVCTAQTVFAVYHDMFPVIDHITAPPDTYFKQVSIMCTHFTFTLSQTYGGSHVGFWPYCLNDNLSYSCAWGHALFCCAAVTRSFNTVSWNWWVFFTCFSITQHLLCPHQGHMFRDTQRPNVSKKLKEFLVHEHENKLKMFDSQKKSCENCYDGLLNSFNSCIGT